MEIGVRGLASKQDLNGWRTSASGSFAARQPGRVGGSARSSGRRAMPYVGSQLLQTHKVAPREATHGVNLSRGQFYIPCLGISPFAHFSALNG